MHRQPSHPPVSADIPTQAQSSEQRAKELFQERLDDVYRRRDRVFVWLMLAQWALAIGMALVITPRTWAGRVHSTHVHVFYAVLMGGALWLPSAALVFFRPGSSLTRHVIAVSQMLWSALLIHVSGGRIETHFHVFGSLAFLAFYRDWSVLLTATLAVSVDHLLRGIYYPQSVYGVLNPEWWRFLEHSAWVVFENVVLVVGIQEHLREMRALAARQADLEFLNARFEQKVNERTNELAASNARLTENIELLHATQRQLVEASRQMGMAEVATTVLHNVGNVLNSVNVSAGVIADWLRSSRVDALPQIAGLMNEQAHDLGRFLTEDARGKRIPELMRNLGDSLLAERAEILGELTSLQKNVDHIKVIVSTQQSHAKSTGGVRETLQLSELLNDALQFGAASRERHQIETSVEYAPLPSLTIDRHKVMQILLNLFSNAKHAVQDRPVGARRIVVRAFSLDDERVAVEVEDTGCGIAPEHLNKIFNFGFTTKKDGHGFGLHSSAIAAKDLGGALSARSEGVNQGATFRLEIPTGQTSLEPAALHRAERAA